MLWLPVIPPLSNPLENPDYGRIINRKHFDRLTGLMDSELVAAGGERREETLQIAPTLMDGVTWDDPVMQEEIFGPILPILTYRDLNQVFERLAHRPKPLALYIFSEHNRTIQEVTRRCCYGGCVNDCVVHLATDMGFGGVGESGMGAYHGKVGFNAFSHSKSLLDKKTWLDLPMRYQPYNRKRYGKLVRFFLK